MLFRNAKLRLTRRALSSSLAEEYWKRYRIKLKDKGAVEGIARAGELVVRTLDMIGGHIAPGITTDALNTLVHDYTLEHGAAPAPWAIGAFRRAPAFPSTMRSATAFPVRESCARAISSTSM
jgi:methionyl aminopeptidase